MPMWGITILYNHTAELCAALSHWYLSIPKVSANGFFELFRYSKEGPNFAVIKNNKIIFLFFLIFEKIQLFFFPWQFNFYQYWISNVSWKGFNQAQWKCRKFVSKFKNFFIILPLSWLMFMDQSINLLFQAFSWIHFRSCNTLLRLSAKKKKWHKNVLKKNLKVYIKTTQNLSIFSYASLVSMSVFKCPYSKLLSSENSAWRILLLVYIL